MKLNKILADTGRQFLKDSLPLCTPTQQRVFKFIYAPINGKVTYRERVALDLKYVIDNMTIDEINSAIYQVQKTLEKNDAKKNISNKL
jgi:hypothetical protein